MRIVFESAVMIPEIYETFAVSTTGAVICINDIRYDATEGVVEIRMKQREMIEPKKTFWGQPIYHSQTWVNAVLTIRHVVAMKKDVDNILVTECNSCFTVMMGMKIDKNEIYLGSLEEVRGKNLCELFIKVKEFNIEFVDSV
jgi:hypothetical protein